MQCLLDVQPRHAIILGSFGLYPGGDAFEPGQLLIPNMFRLIDAAVLAGHAAFPAPMPVTAQPDRAFGDTLVHGADNVLRGAVATTLAITQDDALAQRLGASSDCIAENLEAMAIGLACSAVGVTWTALLGCTNTVGARGRAQWAANHAVAADTTSAHLLAWLAAGAAGLPPSAPLGAAL
jgi:nucleoside phosphorylase